FVTHAGDGSNRLFILEQAGLVDVLQPGSGTPTMFLDIRGKVKSGGEQGLLGLAFHPGYETNGRFFVFFTRPTPTTTVECWRLGPMVICTSASAMAGRPTTRRTMPRTRTFSSEKFCVSTSTPPRLPECITRPHRTIPSSDRL